VSDRQVARVSQAGEVGEVGEVTDAAGVSEVAGVSDDGASPRSGRAARFWPGVVTVARIVAGRQAPSNPIRIIRLLRILAVSEATCFLALLTVGVLHAVTGGWGIELFIMGNVHGAVFTTYLVIITVCHRIVRWGPLMLLMVLLAGFVPGGGLMVERWALAAPGRDPEEDGHGGRRRRGRRARVPRS
jgi:integral membrane protein